MPPEIRILEELLFHGNIIHPDHPMLQGQMTAYEIRQFIDKIMINPLNIPESANISAFKSNLYSILIMSVPGQLRVAAQNGIIEYVTKHSSSVELVLSIMHRSQERC